MDDSKSEGTREHTGKAAKEYTARKVGGMSKIEKEAMELERQYESRLKDEKA